MSDKIFSLEGKGLKLDTADDITPHLAPLLTNDAVEEVRIAGNTLGVGACAALGNALSTKEHLRHAAFADIFTSRLREEIPDALHALLPPLLNCKNLHTIDLSDNAFGKLCEQPLIDFLSKHTPLRHLLLNNNGLGPSAGANIAGALDELATRKKEAGAPELETIICGRNRLENGSMEAWAKMVSSHGKIKTIKMVQNGIRQEGIEDFIRNGLVNCPELEILDLQDNTFTHQGASALADVLPTWKVLRELGVGDCLLSARGGRAVARALAKGQNKGLKTIRLQYNDLTLPSVERLSKTIKEGHLPELEKLELNGNKFSEDDEVVVLLRELLGDDGLDSLSDLEELDSDDEEEEEEELSEDEGREDVVKKAQQDENADVAPEKDKAVDDLADKLAETSVSDKK
ncbi:RNI-like protein [Ascobolus immersus RN42]|uniref:RNI-like protein n=1 Tax=Ascobolus immersus RN42 TaxID=1160509 RepID=A0A3N4IPI7_ASCIM|nr:RNI-like protein [Ascobolus immersus RN42]